MIDFLPKDVRAGLEAARKRDLKRQSRLRVKAGDDLFRVLKLKENGFVLEADQAPQLRGLVDLYDGAKHVSQCLIIATQEEEGGMFYEFKRETPAIDTPPLDFYQEEFAPVALVEDLRE